MTSVSGPLPFVRVNIGDYLGSDEQTRKTLIPEMAGLYVWVFDFLSLLDLPRSGKDKAISAFFQQEGREIVADKPDPFLNARWNAVRPNVRSDRRITVLDLLESDERIRIASLLTYFQRPLYVGISVNLNRRVEEHLKTQGSVSSQLTHIDRVNCAVLWTETPAFAGADIATSEDGEEEPRILNHLESFLISTASPLFNVQIHS